MLTRNYSPEEETAEEDEEILEDEDTEDLEI